MDDVVPHEIFEAEFLANAHATWARSHLFALISMSQWSGRYAQSEFSVNRERISAIRDQELSAMYYAKSRQLRGLEE